MLYDIHKSELHHVIQSDNFYFWYKITQYLLPKYTSIVSNISLRKKSYPRFKPQVVEILVSNFFFTMKYLI